MTSPEWYKAPVEWAWIDTCCIDMSSSSELLEAINSMLRYYRNTQFCVAHLVDVDNAGCEEDHRVTCPSSEQMLKQLDQSEWFQRGWTLQELIVPRSLVFVTATWKVIGWTSFRAYQGLMDRISVITGIPSRVLVNPDRLWSQSIAQQFSWASRRVTTKVEDRAYSLLGLLDVNMPLLYGEGHRAWRRLQEEVLKSTVDESIFAWYDAQPHPGTEVGVLCPSITAFETARYIRRRADFTRLPFVVTSQGLELRLQARTAWASSLDRHDPERVLIIPLNCMFDYVKVEGWRPCLLVLGRRRHCDHYVRLTCLNVTQAQDGYVTQSHIQWQQIEEETIYVHLFDACDTQKTKQYLPGDHDGMKNALGYLDHSAAVMIPRPLASRRIGRFADPVALDVHDGQVRNAPWTDCYGLRPDFRIDTPAILRTFSRREKTPEMIDMTDLPRLFEP